MYIAFTDKITEQFTSTNSSKIPNSRQYIFSKIKLLDSVDLLLLFQHCEHFRFIQQSVSFEYLHLLPCSTAISSSFIVFSNIFKSSQTSEPINKIFWCRAAAIQPHLWPKIVSIWLFSPKTNLMKTEINLLFLSVYPISFWSFFHVCSKRDFTPCLVSNFSITELKPIIRLAPWHHLLVHTPRNLLFESRFERSLIAIEYRKTL